MKLPSTIRLSSLRLAVTDRCNLRCAYCMPAAGIPHSSRSELLSLERLADLVQWLHEVRPFGKIKLTGGEPLVRRGLDALVGRLARLDPPPELSMTTNGTGLVRQAAALAAAGLVRVNVSIDTLDPERYRELTRGGRVADALEGIAAARAAGLTPIKLNSVLRRSSFRDDVPALLDLAVASGLELRFLELMRTGTGRAWCEAEAIPAQSVLAWLDAHPDCVLVHGHQLSQHGPEPARRGRLRWRGHDLEVGWILPVSRPFCDPCDRLRLDPRGSIRRCLMDASRLDLVALLGTGGGEAALAVLTDYLAGKRPPGSMDSPQPMVRLGG